MKRHERMDGAKFISKCLQWMGRRSVLKKLLVSYIILLGLLLVSSLFVYYKTKNLLMTKEVTYNRMALSYTSEIMDQNIKQLYDSCVTLIREKNVQKQLGNIEFIGNQTALVSKLLEFTQKNNLLEHVVLYNPELDYILYEEGSLSLDDEKCMYFDEWQQGKLVEQLEQASIGYIPRSEAGTDLEQSAGGAHIILYFSPRYVAGDNVLLLLLSQEEMRELFKSVYSGNRFMIMSENGEMIVSPEEAVGNEEQMAELMASVQESANGHFRYEDYLVLHDRSTVFDWEYIALIRYADIFQDVNVIRNITLYLLLGIFLLGAVVIIISIRDNYLPLKEILSAVSGESREREENEYDKIRSSIYSLKEDNQLYRENQILYKMIRDGVAESELEEFFEHPLVCGVFLTGSDIDRAEELKTYLENGTQDWKYDVRVVHTNKNEAYLILNQTDISYAQIGGLLEEFLAGHSMKLWAGVGCVGAVSELKNSCDGAKKAFKDGKIGRTGCVYQLQEASECSHILFPIDFENNMLQQIYAADKEQVRKLVSEVLRQNSQISWTSYEKLLLDFHECYSHLVQKTEASLNEDAWKALFSRRLEPEELEGILPGIYEELVFESPIDKRAEYVGRYVKDYVKKNYMDAGITIEGIAGELDLVSTYVSTLFKKEANISFSQYLSDYRIQKAKELLEQTDMKVKDVAVETGFGTYNNFTRVFKKKIGITPNEYKKRGQNL